MDERASVLVVDDLPEKLLVFRTVLEELGQDLVFVRSGADALREVLHREFAVILLDVNMPDIDGFETASLIRKYRKSAHTPIIFVTAYADEMQTALGYSLGAVDYILSPVVPEVLRGKVKVFVELYNMQRRVRRQAEQSLALAAAQAARRAAEEATRRSVFLAQAGRVLGGSLELDATVRRLLDLLVPRLATSAALCLGEATDVTAVWSGHAAGGGTRRLEAVALPPALSARVAQAMATRQRLELDAAALRGWAGDGEDAAVGTVLPLGVGERALGALVVAAAQEGEEWGLLDELADRAAIALENVRLYRSLQGEIIERRQAEAKLQQLNRRKDEFLAMLSHELRNPLAPIRNSVEVIRRLAPPDAKLNRANEVMDRQVQHLTRLVDELLDVARISQGKIGLQLEPIDLQAVVAHSVETVRPYLEARRHVLTLQLPPHAVWLRGDFARLSQVLQNLLNNAAKFTDEGGALVLALAVEGGQAQLSVRDNGIGIEAELLPAVFELFEQGQRTLDRSQGGLGVGLTLVRRLVELHHGRVDVTSAGAGQGTEFHVRLPCLAEVPSGADEPSQAAVEATAAGCRVLVVDDNADAAESVAMFLGMVGHEVKTVGDGPQALACAPVYAPHVVVLDIGLPGLDGYEVARRLRGMPATSASLLIALTGYGSKNDQARAVDAGFDRYLVKPADPTQLAASIAEWLTGRPDASAGTPAGAPSVTSRGGRRPAAG